MRPSTTGSTLLVGLFAGLVLGVMLERWRRRRANAGASVGTRPARAALATDEESAQPSRPRTLVEAETRAVEREQEQEVLEKEAAAAAIEKAEEAEKAPVQLDASLFEENEEESAEAPEATPETAPSAQDVVEPSAMETTTETLEAAPASV